MKKDISLFFSEGLRARKKVGSLIPSSKYLARHMVETIPDGYEGVVVELGPGTGVFTRAILKKLGEKGRLIAFESHPPFVDYLRANISDRRLTVIGDQAQAAPQTLDSVGVHTVKYVISCLPLLSIGKPDSDHILDAIQKILAPGGTYVQVQYLPISLYDLKERFHTARIAHFELRNIPPAFVYECHSAPTSPTSSQ